LDACEPGCGGLAQWNCGLATAEIFEFGWKTIFRGSWLSTAPSFTHENDLKRLIWPFITLNFGKSRYWRFSADDVSMTSWWAHSTVVTWR